MSSKTSKDPSLTIFGVMCAGMLLALVNASDHNETAPGNQTDNLDTSTATYVNDGEEQEPGSNKFNSSDDASVGDMSEPRQNEQQNSSGDPDDQDEGHTQITPKVTELTDAGLQAEQDFEHQSFDESPEQRSTDSTVPAFNPLLKAILERFGLYVKKMKLYISLVP